MSITTFDHYVSLGYNCEVAFQFRRILGKDSASFFSWNITSFDSLKSLLRTRFDGILKAENLEPHWDGSLILDKSHQYYFHSPFQAPNPLDDANFEANLKTFQEKVNYLIEKLNSQANSGERVAYFYRTDEGNARAHALDVYNYLREILNNADNFTLIILQQEEKAEAEWGDVAGIKNRYLRRFAPGHDASDGHVQSYDKVFREFPSKEPMFFAGY